jgi:D-serine deaminase-like pyridoxal phosphate-dependent protein
MLAREVAQLKNIEFEGLMGYEGGLRKFPEFRDRKEATEKALNRLIKTKDMVEDSGLNVGTVSCGGTMSYDIAGEFPGVTEVQAGSYVFMDATYQRFGIDFEISLTLLTRVMSRPRPEKSIIDAGLKAISADSGLPIVKARPELECVELNAEHGHIRVMNSAGELRQGDRLELIPNHVDTTVCLHDNYVATRQGEIEAILEVACRGKLQ